MFASMIVLVRYRERSMLLQTITTPIRKTANPTVMSSLKNLAVRWCPPALVPLVRKTLSAVGVRATIEFSGRFATWEDAQRVTTGYEAEVILNRVAEATMKVLRGEAAFERDAVTFERMIWPWPMLAAIGAQAARDQGELRVLDFGGALGGTYLVVRQFLGAKTNLRWNLVEQPHFVRRAAQLSLPPGIAFFDNVAEAIASMKPNVVLASGVLQCLPRPFEVLNQLVEIGAETLIIDRTPCLPGTQDLITVQSVPSDIFPASFPSWLFAKDRILNSVDRQYRAVASFETSDRLLFEYGLVAHRGWIFERRR